MAFAPSKEQERLAGCENGFVIGVANAGSGKTTTGKELFRRLFKREWSRQFPGVARLNDDQVKSVLRSFFVTSFTVKQSADFDHKIKDVLREDGIVIPSEFGKEMVICRTLDSHLGRMIKRLRFFEAWATLPNSWPNSFAHLIDKLSPAARDVITRDMEGNPVSGVGQVRNFFIRYGQVLTGDLQTMIAESIIRDRSGPKLPLELMPEAMTAGCYKALGQLGAEKAWDWCSEYWDGLVAKWKVERYYFEDLHAHLEKHKAGKPPHEAVHLTQMANAWSLCATVTAKFLNLYQIARARGYDPLFRPKGLGSRAFMEAFCSAEGIQTETIETFHDWAVKYAHFKIKCGLMDFTDKLISFIDVMSSEKGYYLLEKKSSIPKLFFRRLYSIWDEGQDFTPHQMRMVKLLAPGQDQRGLTLVLGDGKQSLYLFAGASPYEFAHLVNEKKQEGDNVFTLSSNFRSARRIVELGNELAATLPSYAKSVFPSIPSTEVEGEINVSPPLTGEQDEAKWLLSRIDGLLKVGETSIMVLFRSEPNDHPIARELQDPKYKTVQLLTVHRAKGLEAKHVFVGGCTSGNFPIPIGETLGRSFKESQAILAEGDRRLFNDQEVNLWYVAGTRAIYSLTFACPVYMMVPCKGGERNKHCGPSPVFWEVPTLRKLCLDAGWSEDELKFGVSNHETDVAAFYARYLDKIQKAHKEAIAAGLKFTQEDFQREANADEVVAEADRKDTAALGIHALLQEKVSRAFVSGPKKTVTGKSKGGAVSDQAALEAILAKCRKAFFDGRPPQKLAHGERDVAFAQGWLTMNSSGGIVFTPEFKQRFRPA